ncbi:MAG: DNA gyrase/topoisomerase IV subunit A [Candidatus Delongbacteria bacterium]|jgi:topoisomerase-4 subunit A|nr:DNA gyrase/topoisomerase IV subunit A [Candidatus Delongbacteria bacterium]
MDKDQVNKTQEGYQYEEKVTKLTGQYQNWFLDYASYVILERAIPHVYDGLKPVQRRILHSMKELDDGRYNKVANIIGHTMKYHPHGDASIGNALVQIGQKNLLIDAQGNWGNTLTGDTAAAPRYIEARLTKFANEVVFNPKTTNWKPSYDGRNMQPVTLPVKFPLLLILDVEGIAVGLSTKILPHNFHELIDACIDTLKGKQNIQIFPDFQSGGMADFSKYNDGKRGGRVRVRSKIEKLSNRELKITEIPYGETTSSVIDSIISANDRGKIKIKKIDDNTSDKVEILIQTPSGISSDKTIDALYAFTNCEVSVSPNACVIDDDSPRFMCVSEILQLSVQNTVHLLKQELQIRLDELQEALFMASLERWFIEERIYKDKPYESAKTTKEALNHIKKRSSEIEDTFVRKITEDDLLKLLEIRMKRIIKYNTDKAEKNILNIKDEIKAVKHDIDNIIDYSINYYRNIKKKYGEGRERKTEIRSFDNIQAQKVVVANQKLYADYKEGFVGTALKKEEYVCECSDIDEIIVFMKNGKYVVTKVSEKAFIGKNVIHIARFKRNDERTIYNVVYRDGKTGVSYIKRFPVTSVTRDKTYDLTQGTEQSKVLYFSANPNGEAEVIKVYLKPKPKLRKHILEFDFQEIAIKGKQTKGNILTKHDIHKITMKQKGVSTLGGRKIYFDWDILRLNVDQRGEYLGEFSGDDKIIVFLKNGKYRLTNFDLTNHFEPEVMRVEKYAPEKVYTAIHYDNSQGYYYLKRFQAEDISTAQNIINEEDGSKLIALCDDAFPQVKIQYGGKHKDKDDELIDAEEFITVKSHKARGKRLTTFETKSVEFTEPLDKTPEEAEETDDATENSDADNPEDKSEDQMKLKL